MVADKALVTLAVAEAAEQDFMAMLRGETNPTADVKEDVFILRSALLCFEQPLRDLVQRTQLRGDAPANAMLAFRHLEDCRMRLGKVIQALEGGVSVYPR